MTQLRQTLLVNFAAVGAGAAEEHYVAQPHPGEWRLVSARICPDTDTAAHAANYTTATVKQGSTLLASWSTQDTAQGALAKGVASTMVYTETGAGAVFGQGDMIEVAKADAAAGAALDATVVLELVQHRS